MNRIERLTDCPVCGEPIDGLAADDRTTIEPCGHSARGLTTTTMTPDTTSDTHRVLTDGGEETVIIPGERSGAHYHRDETCGAVQQMTNPERVALAETDAEPCRTCAAEDHDDIETIEVCPECDRPNFQTVVGSGQSATVAENNYRCRASECGVAFDEPEERARRGGNDGRTGWLAGELMQADAEDVSADNVGGGSA